MGFEICLSLRNPNCCADMALSKSGIRQRATIFDITLYTRLQNEIGLKSARVWGLSHFGINVRKVEFKATGILPSCLAYSIAQRRSSRKRSKKARKNSTGHPSGPGDFSVLKPFNTASTFESVMGSRKQSLSSSCT